MEKTLLLFMIPRYRRDVTLRAPSTYNRPRSNWTNYHQSTISLLIIDSEIILRLPPSCLVSSKSSLFIIWWKKKRNLCKGSKRVRELSFEGSSHMKSTWTHLGPFKIICLEMVESLLHAYLGMWYTCTYGRCLPKRGRFWVVEMKQLNQ